MPCSGRRPVPEEAPQLRACDYAQLQLRAALARPPDALCAAQELTLLLSACARLAARDAQECLAADAVAAAVPLASLASAEARAASRALLAAATRVLPAKRVALVANAHRSAALAARRGERRTAASLAESPEAPVAAISDDALLLVLLQLDARSLARAAGVCAAWRRVTISSDTLLWRPLYALHFPSALQRESGSWRAAFAAAAATWSPALRRGCTRLLCRACLRLAWPVDLQAAGRVSRRGCQLQTVTPEEAAAAQLKRLGLGGGDTSDSGGDSGDDSGAGQLAASFRLWSLPGGI